MISLIGYYTTQFGELWDKSLFDLVIEAINGVLKQTRLSNKQIDAVFFGNMLAGVLENNLHSPSKIAEILKVNIPIFRAEAACASFGAAFNLAKTYLEANSNKNILVVGAEKMTDYSPEETITGLSAASSGEEQEAGLTFPGLYGMMANYYLEKYHYVEENLAYVSVKNHYHGSLNSKAHFRKKISIEDVLSSPYVAFPLKVLDSSPISDGASAVILTNDHNMIKKQKYSAVVMASELVTDTISLKERKQIDEILATKNAANIAFKKAKITRGDIGVAEVHDCFSIAEIMAVEDLGFCKKGEGAKAIKRGEFDFGGRLPVNLSGGLKACGHPVGATGVKQVVELALQLRGEAGERQVKGAKVGLAHNVGGSGGTAVVHLLKKI
ncbi:TPA: thiolase domain-containing protein [Candidatus Beckwithbacteria bacterium]|nr:thiolase domain-containing protein [Candidatus Beckwithbacteria bacterium]